MFWDKRKYIFKIEGGVCSKNTEALKGRAEHIIIEPQSDSTMWSMEILDKDNDCIYKKMGYGRMDDKEGLPLGSDKTDKLTIKFVDVSRDEPIKVILKIREMT
jgi:hypothetical protein